MFGLKRSMGIRLCCIPSCVQTVSLEQLPVDSSDASSASIFPFVDELLQNTEYQKALLYISRRPRDKMEYRSLQDYLFVNTCPEWRSACARYYKNKGKPFRHLLSVSKIARLELRLIHTLDQAEAALAEQRAIKWALLTR